MIDFSRYYIEYIGILLGNIADFFVGFFNIFKKIIIEDIPYYFTFTIDQAKNFNFIEWVALVVVTLINLAVFVFLALKIIQLLRRYFIFRRKEMDKQELVDEIAVLNNKVLQLIDEKNKILSVKVSQMTGKPEYLEEIEEQTEEEKPVEEDSRFVKLKAIDELYKDQITSIQMKQEDLLSLSMLIERFVNFSASQLHLYYTKDTIALYFAAMATSKVIILEGISGTGKTSLPYALSKFFFNEASIVSVQPSWRDRAELMGYLNEFTKRFNETDFLKFLYEDTYRENINFIVLDEMNLARIEYYFAEFLSIMEMPDKSEWKIDIVPDTWPTDPKHLVEGKLLVPQSVWFVGTANKDDSTFTITDKVYDRAIALEFNKKAEYFDAPYTPGIEMSYEYLDSLYQKAAEDFSISVRNQENFSKLDQFIQEKFKIAFGNRIMKQINTFVPVYIACGGNELRGLDFMLRSKILRKFENLNLAFLKDELDELIVVIDRLFGKGVFKLSIDYIRELQKMI